MAPQQTPVPPPPISTSVPPPPVPLSASTSASASGAAPAPAPAPPTEPIPPPPVSPITPTLAPARLPDTATPQPLLPPPRQALVLTHSSQPAQQTAVPPPPPEPLDFDANPDVLALRSAISVLQVQKRRAAADMQTLTRAKDEALADPEAFMRDLAAGKVHSRGDEARYVPGSANDDEDDDEDEDDDDSSDEDADSGSKPGREPKPKAWTSLPQPQNVVRCPPINWSQYAVVGESLDKLHAEQVSRPTQGTPASIGTGGVYEFKGDGRQEKYPGVAAPYAPGKDRIDKKPKGKRS